MNMSTSTNNNNNKSASTAHESEQLNASNSAALEARSKLIAAVENMKYTELVAECKALKLKPSDRTR